MLRVFRNIIVAVLLSFMFVSCHPTTSQLEKDVKNLANKNLVGTGVRATNVTLIHEDGNNYSGEITLTANGEDETYKINVVCDGRNFRYEIPALLGN